VLCPGGIRTPLVSGGRYGRSKLDPAFLSEFNERIQPVLMEPSRLASRVLHAVDRNRAIIIEPKWWRFLWHIDRMFPWLGPKLLGGILPQLTGRHVDRKE